MHLEYTYRYCQALFPNPQSINPLCPTPTKGSIQKKKWKISHILHPAVKKKNKKKPSVNKSKDPISPCKSCRPPPPYNF